MNAQVEPQACYAPFSTEANGFHYLWRGWGQGEKETTIGIYDSLTEQWTLQPTTGSPPLGVGGGGCVSIGNHLYCFGGHGESFYFNNLHELNLEAFQWSKLHPSCSSECPLRKVGCSVFAVNERTLGCFGGFSNDLTYARPGSTCTSTKSKDGTGWTNEMHFFDIQAGKLHTKQILAVYS